jgi:hypothetical protein
MTLPAQRHVDRRPGATRGFWRGMTYALLFEAAIGSVILIGWWFLR